jgi:hypothetical protein
MPRKRISILLAGGLVRRRLAGPFGGSIRRLPKEIVDAAGAAAPKLPPTQTGRTATRRIDKEMEIFWLVENPWGAVPRRPSTVERAGEADAWRQ